ncbi:MULTISPECIES: TM0106 family RecB-like putative nuclease [unclassified Corynebacterium]|uniref:TM0106 family RecB-like putative nuclease n=1 Tax=unclassified Corynebacterium TaxID=2624378 RepID=UPI0029CA8EEF|nr:MULTISPECIES: TM0106 family RecB-like putative nuclease [unclassified Corynebacterium]WPF66071.1 TM0106 family RecB-like putative nuclease [Corynebacterium sp. 22KM0430]WPF68563.1 TM0106 family RecB-like putative nuclease [Corynebacterium sp. 21KM1197]
MEKPSQIAPIRAQELLGCRYKQVQRRRFPGTPPTEASRHRARRKHTAVAAVTQLLPTGPAPGDSRGRRFVRVRIDSTQPDADLDTLEALAQGATLIEGAVFEGTHAGITWRAEVELLALLPDATYLPVAVTNHRVARPAPGAHTPVIATQRLGLSAPHPEEYALKHHSSDSFRLALAARALEEYGLGTGLGGLIGQDRARVFLTPTAPFQRAVNVALEAPVPAAPRRLKECAACRFWERCEPMLRAADDLSLFLPGDRGRRFRERGIETVTGLAKANLGEPSALAEAWQRGVPVLRRSTISPPPRAEVEIDIDVEAYLDQGAYLWGTYDGRDYRPFITWDGLGGEAEAHNFAEFWGWLMGQRARARERGQTFRVYCYARNGENHWLRSSARRLPGGPSEEEVRAFIRSEDWVDVFDSVTSSLAGPYGLGLKIVAPQAGFRWRDQGFDGEESVNAYRVAIGLDAGDAAAARRLLLRYNEDDCRATAAVRAWLSGGAPGAEDLRA